MPISNLKNNFCLSVSDSVSNICKPLFEHTDIDYLTYVRIYRNNKILALESKPGYLEWIFANEKYNVARPTIAPEERAHKDGYYLVDNWHENDTNPELISLAHDSLNIFHHYHGLNVMKSTADYNEFFEFNTTNKNASMNDWYFANLDLFDKFIAYFKEKAAPLIKQAEQNCLQVTEYKSIGEVRYDAEVGLITEQNRQKSMKKNEINRKLALLTVREKECVYWLFCGKTIPEISLILGISKRTVEKFVINVKKKFDCCTLFQLGNILSAFCDKLMLLEKLNLQRKFTR